MVQSHHLWSMLRSEHQNGVVEGWFGVLQYSLEVIRACKLLSSNRKSNFVVYGLFWGDSEWKVMYFYGEVSV